MKSGFYILTQFNSSINIQKKIETCASGQKQSCEPQTSMLYFKEDYKSVSQFQEVLTRTVFFLKQNSSFKVNDCRTQQKIFNLKKKVKSIKIILFKKIKKIQHTFEIGS